MMSAGPFFLDQILFIVFPYVSVIIFLLVSIRRYKNEAFTFSSLSSQFLENQSHFWGLVPFHFGIITVLTGHVIAFLIPRKILAWNSLPVRLYLLELAALIAALLTLVGLASIILRRLTDSKVRTVTSWADWIVLGSFVVQILSGLYVAVFHSWGSSWFAALAAPYLWSLVKLNPDITYITALPWMVKLHIVSAWLLIAFAPFTRLVHILVVPNPYLWRKPQVVRWYGVGRLRMGKRTA
ncbi:MAG: respiratory nitrate reductase subunit gamma [candidate division KSB1 bacterium]|nr:respiratory nitrate reductase subunit gamma [candidate division KSB1 bacterium]MDZ7300700.1 respiratory nitrate reductase subunit gamma [candidate division KSB1 bacterium]MDZ7310030.1 respiratory nitrate reductase subunit gamma [candidate division KSB1 bacterium]